MCFKFINSMKTLIYISLWMHFLSKNLFEIKSLHHCLAIKIVLKLRVIPVAIALFLRKTLYISNNNVGTGQNIVMFQTFKHNINDWYKSVKIFVKHHMPITGFITNKNIPFTEYWILWMYCQKNIQSTHHRSVPVDTVGNCTYMPSLAAMG